MMPEKSPATFAPDKETIEKHLNFLFGGAHEYKDGRFEINQLVAAENYPLDEIVNVSGIASQKNAAVSVYVVPSLLDPDCFPVGRCGGDDFYASNVIWCDIDNEHDAEILKQLYAIAPPNRAVVTARYPHRRIQLWWRLLEPITDADTLTDALTGVMQALGGDPKVAKPCQPMRLAGTVNYPSSDKLKKGRIVEQTEYIEIHDRPIDIDTFMAAYPVKDYEQLGTIIEDAQNEITRVRSGPLGIEETVEDGRETYAYKMICASILHFVQENGCWPTPQEVFDDVWPVYSKKVAPRSESLDKDGRGSKFISQKIKSKLRLFINGGMKRYGWADIEQIVAQRPPVKTIAEVSNIEITLPINADEKPSGLKATSIDDIDLDNIPPREFLYGTILGRKYVTMLVAPPGAGKSIFTMQLAMSAASSVPWGEWKPVQKNLNVWVYNNEEGQDELYRRIRAIMLHNNINKGDFGGRFYIDSGENKAISIAQIKDDAVVYTPDYEGLLQEVINRKIDILVIDPFAETHSVTENSNEQIKDVVRLYREIAFRANCSVLLVHHTRKGASEMAGEADSARGGGAQIGVVRRMFTLSTMTKNEAEKMGVPPEKRKWFARFDDAKTNITAPADFATWFKFTSVSIMNGVGLYPEGDKVGVMEHINTDKIQAEFADEMEGRTAEILTLIVEMMDSKDENVSQVTDIIDYIKSFSKLRFSDRALRDMVKDAVEKVPKATPFIAEGVAHSFSIINGTGPKKNAISVRKTSENLEI